MATNANELSKKSKFRQIQLPPKSQYEAPSRLVNSNSNSECNSIPRLIQPKLKAVSVNSEKKYESKKNQAIISLFSLLLVTKWSKVMQNNCIVGKTEKLTKKFMTSKCCGLQYPIACQNIQRLIVCASVEQSRNRSCMIFSLFSKAVIM